MTSDQHNTVWGCKEPVFGGTAEYTLSVNTPVSVVTIQASYTGYPDVPVVYENEAKTFECATNGYYPLSSVTLTVSGASSQINSATSGPVNGLYVTRGTFTVTATRQDHGKIITCIATNNIAGKPPVSQTITLDVYYAPTITLNATTIVIEEGSSVNRVCSASGHPTPVVIWYRGNTALTSGTGASASLSYSNVGRGITGTYKCKATALNIPSKILRSEASVSVIVQYPPTARVIVPSEATENDRNVQIVCNVTGGVPSINTFHTWSHYIGGTTIRSGILGTVDGNNYVLVFSSVSYDDLGDYSCGISNGIRGRRSNLIQNASAYFNVKASAKFNSSDRRMYARHNEFKILSIPFYSNPAALLKNIKLTNGSSGLQLTQSSYISFDLVNTKVEKRVHGTSIFLEGQTLIITFKPFLKHYAGNYTINIANGGALTSSFSVQIIASAPPQTPVTFGIYDKTASSITLSWTAGVNGGHPQIFVVQYERSGIITKEIIEEKGKQSNYMYKHEVFGLNSSTTYYFWLYSKNEIGNSNLVSETPLKATTASIVNTPEPNCAGAVAGSVVGSIVSLVTILAVVMGVMHYKRRVTRNNGQKKELKVYENQGLADTIRQNENEQKTAETPTYKDSQNKGNETQDSAPSQESKYEDLIRTQETNMYEGINLSENVPVDKVYYMNTKLSS